MTRRRAVREVARIEPGQVAILECDRMISQEQVEEIKAAWRKVANTVDVIVLGEPIHLAGICNVRPWKRAR